MRGCAFAGLPDDLADKRCVQCGDPARSLCDFPLKGTKLGQTCNRPVCARCSVSIRVLKYCPAHGAMTLKKQVKPDITLQKPPTSAYSERVVRSYRKECFKAAKLPAAQRKRSVDKKPKEPEPSQSLDEAVKEFDQVPL